MKRFEKIAYILTIRGQFASSEKRSFVEICFRNEGVEVRYCDDINPSYGSRMIERYFFPMQEVREIRYFNKPYLS